MQSGHSNLSGNDVNESFTHNTETACDNDVIMANQENVPTQSQNDILIYRVVSNNKLESVKDERQSKDRCIYPKMIPENSLYSNMAKSRGKVCILSDSICEGVKMNELTST